MPDYSDKVKDHFLNPRNVGEIPQPHGLGEVGSIASGDALRLTFKLNDENRIETAKVMTFGGACAVAAASALTEMIMGRTLEEIEKISAGDIAEYLDGLPPERMHCAELGRQVMEKAIQHYRGSPEEQQEGEVICECFGVTDLQIRRAVTENRLTSVEQVAGYTRAGSGCTRCHDSIRELVDTSGMRVEPETVEGAEPKLTNIRKIKMIEETIDREIRPSLRHDGGDIELVDVVDNHVLVATRGTCAGCRASQQTLKGFVEPKLRELVSADLVVEEVSP